ncbi:UNVERIFIED_ORG: hypothetical protein BCL66_105251 [Martelella mediterranea]
MITWKSTILASTMVVVLATSSCSTVAIDPDTMSPAEVALRQEQNERVRIMQGVATGAGIGALIGGGLAAVMGGDGDDILKMAALGAVAGGMAGGADANRVNSGAGAQAAEQQRYKQVIANANNNIAYYKGVNRNASTIVRDANRDVSKFNAQYKSGAISKSDYRSKMASARGNVRILDGNLNKIDTDINDLQNSGVNVSSKVNTLKAQKRALERERDALVKAYSRVPSDVGNYS